MIRIAIAEDAREPLDLLRGYLDRYGKERGQDIEITCFPNGLELVEGYSPVYDVLLLDIEMPYMDGMTAARKIRETDRDVLILFITNMAKYAVHGYEVDAIGYMLKPVTYFAFCLHMDKAANRLKARSGAELRIKTGDSMQRVRLSDLLYVEISGHYLAFYTTAGKLMAFGRLSDLEQELGGQGFFRCSNSCLVNLRHCMKIDGSAVTVGSTELPISRRRRKEFIQALNEYLGRGYQ